jgi:hypothetical protein
VRLLGAHAEALDLHSYLEYGVYKSPSMSLGLAFAALAALLVARILRSTHALDVREPAALALIALAAAGSKGTVVPVTIAASAALVLWQGLRKQPLGPALVTFLAQALPAAPVTILLAAMSGSHSALFHVQAWNTLTTSGAYAACARALGFTPESAPHGLAWILAGPWLVLASGLAGVLAVLGLVRRRAGLSPAELWLAFAALAGGLVAISLAGPALTELFFLYPAQIALALLAGVALVSTRIARRTKVVLAALLLPLPLAGAAIDIAAQLRRDVLPKPVESALLAEHRAALVWIREHTPRESVILNGTPEICASARAERGCIFETDRYEPESMAQGWEQVNGRWFHRGFGCGGGPRRARRAARSLRGRARLDAVREARQRIGPERPAVRPGRSPAHQPRGRARHALRTRSCR